MIPTTNDAMIKAAEALAFSQHGQEEVVRYIDQLSDDELVRLTAGEPQEEV